MTNLENARDAFLNKWFDATTEGSHWTDAKSVDITLEIEETFNLASLAALGAVPIDGIPVAEYQMLNENGKWQMTTDPDYFKQDHAWKTDVRELVDADDVRSALVRHELIIETWKTAFEEGAVLRKKLSEGLKDANRRVQEAAEEIKTLKAEIERLNKQIENEDSEDHDSVSSTGEVSSERDETVRTETFEIEPLRTAIQTVQGSKHMATTEVLVLSVGHMRDLFEIVKHAEDHPAVVLFAQLLAENAEKKITDYLEVSVGFYRQIYRVAMKFEEKVDWYGWVRGLAMAFKDAGQNDDAVQLGLLIKHMKTERKMLHQAIKALKPFAKAGQLFGPSISEYDETVYNPAAGPEFYILGSHLRQARATYINIKGTDA
ncbi:hypothetical protein [Mesorhizobium sp. SP-1A]|uniref:hypothetical protein n=1 Tax=Mesorhizobium sp. SP-1A TaxID=3077840 RepID=UPI0028F7258C|nr:hypothetical protein [Mesorhizobium sp. SP-1A]